MTEVDIEIDRLELSISSDPNNLSKIASLINKCISSERKSQARQYVANGIRVSRAVPFLPDSGYDFVVALMNHWKNERYSNKEPLRVNITGERRNLLNDTKWILDKIMDSKEESSSLQKSMFQLASVYENMGAFQEGLILLSNLISIQASDGVELSSVILHAAVLLMTVGQSLEAIEYLEYLKEDPPVTSGYTTVHISALLLLIYEQAGDKYVTLVAKKYEELQAEYLDYLRETMSSSPALNRATELFSRRPMSECAEVWETLGMQAVDRCDLPLAVTFLGHAVTKSPVKPSVLHLLAELYLLLGQRQHAAECAQAAFSMLGGASSSELRNLLLIVGSDDWREALRGAPSSAAYPPNDSGGTGSGGGGDSRVQRVQKSKGDGGKKTSKLVPVKAAANDWEREGASLLAVTASSAQTGITHLPDALSSRPSPTPDSTLLLAPVSVSSVAVSSVAVSSHVKTALIEPNKKATVALKLTTSTPRVTKPTLSEEARKFLAEAQKGNSNVHFYEPELKLLSELRIDSKN